MQIYFQKLLRSFCLSLAAVLLSSGVVVGQEQLFELDPSLTTVNFTLEDVLHTVRGSFKAKSGGIHFDLGSGASSGSFLVDATTGESGNSSRDHKMHKEVLESSRYPEISFSPTKIVGKITDGSSVQVDGVFHIHGSDHPIALTVPLVLKGNELPAKFHFVIPYVEWGMKNPSTFVLRVGKEVDIDIIAVGRLRAQ